MLRHWTESLYYLQSKVPSRPTPVLHLALVYFCWSFFAMLTLTYRTLCPEDSLCSLFLMLLLRLRWLSVCLVKCYPLPNQVRLQHHHSLKASTWCLWLGRGPPWLPACRGASGVDALICLIWILLATNQVLYFLHFKLLRIKILCCLFVTFSNSFILIKV